MIETPQSCLQKSTPVYIDPEKVANYYKCFLIDQDNPIIFRNYEMLCSFYKEKRGFILFVLFKRDSLCY